MNERGQTAYDYLFGVILLLVAIIAALTFLPQLLGPFFDPASTDEQEMAERVSAEVIETNTTAGGERTLNLTGNSISQSYLERIKEQAAVPERRNVNITIQNGPADILKRGGETRRAYQPAATSVRQIRLRGSGVCQYGCQLVVRVW